MTHKIKSVAPKDNMILEVYFENGSIRQFDIKSLYDKHPQFKVLEEDNELYKLVKVDVGGRGISWNDQLDYNAEDIFFDGTDE